MLLAHFLHQKSALGSKGAPRGIFPEIKSPFGRPFGALFVNISVVFAKQSGSEIGGFFSSIFWSPWALQGMGSHAIRTRRRSPNALFHFHTFSKKWLPTDLILGPFWKQVSSKIRILSKKRAPKNGSKKGCPPLRKQPPMTMARGSLTAPLACALFWTRNNYLSKKQEQLLISESISEPFSWNGLFFDFMSEEMFMFWWNLKQKRQVIANVFALTVPFQRLVIWHALGQGPANLRGRPPTWREMIMCWQFDVLFLFFCFFLFRLLLLLRLRFRRCFSFSASFGPTFWRPWAAF